MENPFLPACFVLNLFVSRAETTTMWSAKLKRCFFCNNCRVHSSVYKCIWLISILSSPYFALYQGQVQRRLHPLLSEALLPLPSVNIDSNKWGPKEALQQVQSISRFGLLFIVLFYIKLTSTTFFVLNSNEQLFFFFCTGSCRTWRTCLVSDHIPSITTCGDMCHPLSWWCSLLPQSLRWLSVLQDTMPGWRQRSVSICNVSLCDSDQRKE